MEKVISIPLKRRMKVEQFIIPYYPYLGKEGRYGMTGIRLECMLRSIVYMVQFFEKPSELNPDSKNWNRNSK